MKRMLAVLSIGCACNIQAQTTPGIETIKFYEALNKGDSLTMSGYLSDHSIVQHVDADTSFSFDKMGFLGICKKFRSGRFHEEFEFVHESEAMGNVATVQIDFKFFLNGKLDHCGTDFFVWVIRNNQMQIEQIISTPCSCEEKEAVEKSQKDGLTEQLNRWMDNWHAAAAESNFEAYFSAMSKDFYYLGTDPTERWSKEAFASFCKPYFEKGKGWDFKRKHRNWYFSQDRQTAWFDELLDTWMLDCRGSGVLQRDVYGEWKLDHYNLTVLIENDKIKEFIKLRKAQSEREE